MTQFLNRDQILAAADLPIETVAVPEWGGTVLVRGLAGDERDQFESDLIVFEEKKTKKKTDIITHVNRDSLENTRARLCALCIVDDTGKRIFDDEDIFLLGQKSAVALQRVYDKARELSGLSDDDIEELTKNSASVPSAGSGLS